LDFFKTSEVIHPYLSSLQSVEEAQAIVKPEQTKNEQNIIDMGYRVLRTYIEQNKLSDGRTMYSLNFEVTTPQYTTSRLIDHRPCSVDNDDYDILYDAGFKVLGGY